MITTGLLLAAGEGSRLRDQTPYKPLCIVAGRPLIDRALNSMAEAGLIRAIVTLGYGADVIAEHLAARDWPLNIETVVTDHRQPNGVSALSARAQVGKHGAVMAMCDHLVQPAHYRRLAESGAGDGLTLGIDLRLGHEWVDPADVTCVATEGDRIVAIGKRPRTARLLRHRRVRGRRCVFRWARGAGEPVADRGRPHPRRTERRSRHRLQRSRLDRCRRRPRPAPRRTVAGGAGRVTPLAHHAGRGRGLGKDRGHAA